MLTAITPVRTTRRWLPPTATSIPMRHLAHASALMPKV
jgi:hypothetical protein